MKSLIDCINDPISDVVYAAQDAIKYILIRAILETDLSISELIINLDFIKNCQTLLEKVKI